MIPDRLKKIIFRKLYNDLSHVEIISFRNSIWFIDREEKYWYFELQSDGTLWWRYQFFSDFFILFSLERDDYQSILARWVEEVLNSRVYRTSRSDWDRYSKGDSRVYTTMHHKWGIGLPVEEVLNSRVNKTSTDGTRPLQQVEEVLNFRVHTTSVEGPITPSAVEEVLNFRVHTTGHTLSEGFGRVEDVLNSSVNTTHGYELKRGGLVEEALNSRVNTTKIRDGFGIKLVEEVLNSKVYTTPFDMAVQTAEVEEVLNCGDRAPTIGEGLNHKVSQAKEGELFDESIVDTVLSSLRSF
jgi:hypothetical protein